MLGIVELVDNVRLGRSDAARELQELRWRQLLCPGDQYLVLVKRVFYFFKLIFVQGSKIDLPDFDSEPVAELV